MVVYTKRAVDVFAPTTAGGAPRGASMGETQTWGTEIEGAIVELEGKIVEDVNGEAIIIAVSGQSNIDNIVAYPITTPHNLFYWNATANSPGTTFAPADNIISMALSYAEEIARNYPSRPVYVVSIGRGSTAIANWLPSPPVFDMYAALKAGVEAMLAAIGAAKITHFLWWQGETDYFNASSTYAGDFQTLWSRLLGETWFPRETPITVMSVSERYIPDLTLKYFNRTLRRVVDFDPMYRVFVDSSGLDSSHWTDPSTNGLHANGKGLYVMGKLAYDATFSGRMVGRNATRWETVHRRETQQRTATGVTPDPELKLFLRSGGRYAVRGKIYGLAPAGGFAWSLGGAPSTYIIGKTRYIHEKTPSAETLAFFGPSAGYPSGTISPSGGGNFVLEFDFDVAAAVSANALLNFGWALASGTGTAFLFSGSYIEMIEIY